MANTSTGTGPKAGIFTSEFWLILATIVAQITGIVKFPPILTPILVGVYTLVRGLVKAGFLKGTIADIIAAIGQVFHPDSGSTGSPTT